MSGNSKYCERIIKYKLIDFGGLLILGICCIAFILLLLVASEMYHRAATNFVPTHDNSINAINSEFAQKSVTDSAISTQAYMRLEILEESVALLKNESETYIADLRQESNNIINKFNAWLGFWLGILTIFAGIVPIVIQFILRNKARKEKEEILKEIRQYAMIHKIEMCVSSVCIDKENPVIIDSNNKVTIINKFIYETHKDFSELISLIDSQQGILEPDVELQVVNALIQYCRLIEVIKKSPGKNRRRELNEMSDYIKAFISDLYSDKYRTREMIWEKLRALHSKLLGLRY